MTYASAVSASRQKSYRRNQNSVSFKGRDVAMGPISNFIVLLVLVCLLAVIYLSQVSRTNTYSYSLDTLSSQKQQLVEDYSSLEVENARLQSIERVKQSRVATELTEPGSISYVN